MEILEVYREKCEKCGSDNTRSYTEFDDIKITIVCKDCGHRKEKESNRRREMREKLAEYAHNQWSGWMEYLFSKCYTVYLEPTLQEPDGEAHLVIPKWAVDRWKRQMQTPYNDLSEEEKESDRKEADGMIAILTK